MKIGMIGSGSVGQTLSELFVKIGEQVVITNRHGESGLEDFLQRYAPNVQYGSLAQTVQADLIILAVPFYAVAALDPKLLTGKNIVDATNYYPGRDGRIKALQDHQVTSSELVAQHFTGVKVVKAFNLLAMSAMNAAQNHRSKVALPVAGDTEIKKILIPLIEKMGFDTYDVGSLAESYKIQADSSLFLQQKTKAELTRELG